MKRRGSGILCHITSLSSPFGIGDLGPGAYAFADFLSQAGQIFWQVLPVNPTNRRYFDSPFTSLSSCAGNTALISPELLAAAGLLTQAEIEDRPAFAGDMVDYEAASRFKKRLFERAYSRFAEAKAVDADFARFVRGNDAWLEDHAFFTALTDHLGGIPLSEWPRELTDRSSSALSQLRRELDREVEREKFLQCIFFKQWHALKNYCNFKGISIVGDFPMFMSYDAVDVWAAPEIFKVDENRKPLLLAGSPPDSFSADGQLFNCAVYDWEALKREEYAWWLRRFRLLFKLYDIVRIDHFRGFVATWEVPAGEMDGKKGSWHSTPGVEFFRAMLRRFPSFPVIAEDLGVITPDVREAMAALEIPGMKILLLAFQQGAMERSYLPHHHHPASVVYTGTHDTNTIQGWFDSASSEEKEGLFRYLGREVEEEVNWEFIRMAMMSVCRTAIIQMQDVIGTGAETRMNTPGKAEGNWQWRLPETDLSRVAARLAAMTDRYGRDR